MGVAKAKEKRKHEMSAHALLGCRSLTNTVSEISSRCVRCQWTVKTDRDSKQAGRGEREGGDERDKDQLCALGLRSPDGEWIAQCERRKERGRYRQRGERVERGEREREE